MNDSKKTWTAPTVESMPIKDITMNSLIPQIQEQPQPPFTNLSPIIS